MAIKKATTTADVVEEPKAEKVEGYKKVVSPQGITTTVPDSIVDALIDSGYTAGK